MVERSDQEIETEFRALVELVKEGGELRPIVEKLAKEIKLKIYSLGKQGLEGDNNTQKPGVLSPIERVKWNAWNDLKGMDKKAAMIAFIELVVKEVKSKI